MSKEEWDRRMDLYSRVSNGELSEELQKKLCYSVYDVVVEEVFKGEKTAFVRHDCGNDRELDINIEILTKTRGNRFTRKEEYIAGFRETRIELVAMNEDATDDDDILFVNREEAEAYFLSMGQVVFFEDVMQWVYEEMFSEE